MVAVEGGIRDISGDMILTENVNVTVIRWAITTKNGRGRLLLMITRLAPTMVNEGQVMTYQRSANSFGESISDATFAMDDILHVYRVER